jgi:hypothetical protein
MILKFKYQNAYVKTFFYMICISQEYLLLNLKVQY